MMEIPHDSEGMYVAKDGWLNDWLDLVDAVAKETKVVSAQPLPHPPKRKFTDALSPMEEELIFTYAKHL